MKPCQPFSHAGKRDGTDDDRHIWPHIARAIRTLRPRYVFLENVAGHLSLGFGDVLGDLAEAGYDAQWTSLRASDVGAPHGRNRLFILATDAKRRGRRKNDSHGRDMVREDRIQGRWNESPSPSRPDPQAPTDTQRVEPERRGNDRNVAEAPGRSESETLQRERDGDTVSHSGPTPTNSNGINGINGKESRNARPRAGNFGRLQPRADRGTNWGEYLPAVQRWGTRTGRPAPHPTTINESGRTVLDPAFVEWMMGLPAGWVTDVPGISRTGQLHLLGNGVVPQQARAALVVIA